MKVRLQTSRVGTDYVQDFGSIIEVSDAEAARLLASGQAIAVSLSGGATKPVIQTATINPAVRDAALQTRPRIPRS